LGKHRLFTIAVALFVAWLDLAPGAAAQGTQAAREQVGKPVQAAEQLLKQKKLKEALAKLREADAVPNKSPYEIYVIEATRAAVDLDAADDPAAIKALEAALSTGILPPAEALPRVATMALLAYRIKDYPAVVTYAERYYNEGGGDPAPRLLMAQAYYLRDDFADAAKTSRLVLQDAEKAGKPPSETVLQMLASSEFKQGNEAGYRAALTRLVAASPKRQYWIDLLAAVQRKPGFAGGRLALDLDRLRAATGAMDRPDQYMDAAQLALQAGLPGDAKAFLDKGYAAGVLGKGAEAERQKRLAEMASRQSVEDIKGLAGLPKEAEGAATGLPWVRLGEAYAGYGRYDEAIAALQKGIAKGGLDYPDDARLHLGIAYINAKRAEKAKATLAAVRAADGAQDLAQLWLIAGGVK
jgi:tetratricopeptide (TPR) repeat protein